MGREGGNNEFPVVFTTSGRNKGFFSCGIGAQGGRRIDELAIKMLKWRAGGHKNYVSRKKKRGASPDERKNS